MSTRPQTTFKKNKLDKILEYISKNFSPGDAWARAVILDPFNIIINNTTVQLYEAEKYISGLEEGMRTLRKLTMLKRWLGDKFTIHTRGDNINIYYNKDDNGNLITLELAIGYNLGTIIQKYKTLSNFMLHYSRRLNMLKSRLAKAENTKTGTMKNYVHTTIPH